MPILIAGRINASRGAERRGSVGMLRVRRRCEHRNINGGPPRRHHGAVPLMAEFGILVSARGSIIRRRRRGGRGGVISPSLSDANGVGGQGRVLAQARPPRPGLLTAWRHRLMSGYRLRRPVVSVDDRPAI